MGKQRKKVIHFILLISLILQLSFTTYADNHTLCSSFGSSLPEWVTNSIFLEDTGINISQNLSKPITRAELASIICGIFAFRLPKNTLYILDVPSDKWYHSSIQKVLSKGIMNFYSLKSAYYFHPNANITYYEAALSLAKAYKLDSTQSLASKGSNLSAVFTRKDCIALLNVLTKDLINRPIKYIKDVDGNLIVCSSDVILKNMLITGNLYLTEGIGKGCVTLDNVQIKGTVHVNGCGQNSLKLKNKTFINAMIVENSFSTVRLCADKKDCIENLILLTPTIIDGPLNVPNAQSAKYAIYPPINTLSSHASSSDLDTTSSPNVIFPSVPITSIPHESIPPAVSLPNESTTTPVVQLPDDPEPLNPPATNPDSPTTLPSDPAIETPIELPYKPTTESAIITAAPQNLSIDFRYYPSISISWDNIIQASSYHLFITEHEDSSKTFSLQTTNSSINIDSSLYSLVFGKEYTISVTAAFKDNLMLSTTKTLSVPNFMLEEENNGTLWLKTTNNDPNSIPIKNLQLGIFKEQKLSSNQIDNASTKDKLLHATNYNSLVSSHLVPITLDNDITYKLKIINPNIPDDSNDTLNTYTATFFANATLNEAVIESSIELTTARHLNNLSLMVSRGLSTKGKCFKLLNDIDFNTPFETDANKGEGNFIPIGVKVVDINLNNSLTQPPAINIPFEGDFEGNHHVLSNLRIILDKNPFSTANSEVCAALFAYTTGNIRNITLDSSCIITAISSKNTIYCTAAGIAAYADFNDSSKSISGCQNFASITSNNYASGIVGLLYTSKYTNSSTSLYNCNNYGLITGNSNAAGIVCFIGLTSNCTIIITNCCNYGAINGIVCAGGIVCESQGALKSATAITDCRNFGCVSITCKRSFNFESICAGILALGHNQIKISNCLNGASISNLATVTYPLTNTHRKSTTVQTGGIAGRLAFLENTLNNNYNYGALNSSLLGIGKINSGAILANVYDFSNITHCYTLQNLQITPKNTQTDLNNVPTLSADDFIKQIRESFPDFSDYIDIPSLV